MLIRADIDKQDILDVARDTRRWRSRETVSLGITAALLATILIAAGFSAYLSIEAMLGAAAQGGGASPLALVLHGQADAMPLLVSAAIFGAAAAAGYSVYRARRKLAAAKLRQKVKGGLTTGRFEYMFSDKHLIIKGPLEIRKIAWTLFTRMEDAKSSIVFWGEDGGFEFLPKNVLPPNVTFETLRRDFQPRIAQALPLDEALHAAQLTVTFERMESDGRDYLDRYFQRIEGRLSFIRRLFAWTPAPAFLFLVFSFIAGIGFYAGLRTVDLTAIAASFLSAFFAVGLVMIKPDYFFRDARPLFKNDAWPFQQSVLTSVTLTKEAVFWRERGVHRIIQWDAIEELIECPLTAYLVVTPEMAIALPKRAFLGVKHYEPFIGFAHSRIGAAGRARAERKEQRLARSIGKQKAAPAPVAAKGPEAASKAPPVVSKSPSATVTNIRAAAARRNVAAAPQAKAG